MQLLKSEGQNYVYLHIIKADKKVFYIHLHLSHPKGERYAKLAIKQVIQFSIDNTLAAGNFTRTSKAISDGFFLRKAVGGIIAIRDGPNYSFFDLKKTEG